MRKIALILTLLLLVLLVSCSFRDNTYPARPMPTNSPPPSENPENNPDIYGEIPYDDYDIEKDNPEENSNDVKTLLAKSKGITNYYYLYDNEDIESYEILVKDSRMKKVYVTPVKLSGETFYDEVYLDSSKKTAIAICTKTSVLCDSSRGKAYSLNYENQLPKIDPVNLINQVKTAQKVGTQVIDNRQTTVLEYINVDGKREKLFVDDFYGIPLQQIIYENEEDEILEKHLFAKLSVGNVKENEITMPSSYTLQE